MLSLGSPLPPPHFPSQGRAQPPERANNINSNIESEPEKKGKDSETRRAGNFAANTNEPFKIPGITSIPRTRILTEEEMRDLAEVSVNNSNTIQQPQLTSTQILDEGDAFMDEQEQDEDGEKMDTSRKEFELARESKELLGDTDSDEEDGERAQDNSPLDDFTEPMQLEARSNQQTKGEKQVGDIIAKTSLDKKGSANAGRTPPQRVYNRRLSAHNPPHENEVERKVDNLGAEEGSQVRQEKEKSDRKRARDAARAQTWQKNEGKNVKGRGRAPQKEATEEKKASGRRNQDANSTGNSEGSQPRIKKTKQSEANSSANKKDPYTNPQPSTSRAAIGEGREASDHMEEDEPRTYADAVNDARTVVIIHTAYLLNQDDFVQIQNKLYSRLLTEDDVLPNVVKTSLKQGVIILTLQHQEDVAIFEREIPSIELDPSDPGELKVLKLQDYRNLHRVNCRVSDHDPQTLHTRLDMAKKTLLKQNRTLKANSFTVVGAFARRNDRLGGTLKLRGDSGFLDAIKALQFTPFYGMGLAYCYVLEQGGEQQAAAGEAEEEEQGNPQ